MVIIMKIFALLLLVAVSFTDAVEVTDEDINSPLLSYLLAKVQRLEAKQMVGIRNTIDRLQRSLLNHLLLLPTINSVTVHQLVW